MNRTIQKIRDYLNNVDIDINERLGVFFINIGIVAAILGTMVSLIEHAPISGTMSAALIAAGAPLVAGFTRHTNHPERYGSVIAIMIIIMIPVIWLTTGTISGGSSFWFLYELFYIALFTKKKQILPYYGAAILMQMAAIAADYFHPEWFFHFTNRLDAFISVVGTGVVVSAEIVITVLVQKVLYVHEREINTESQDVTRNFVTSIANTLDTKDPYTGGHSRRVAECASAIALRLGMTQEEADNMYFVALLHDIGKIGVPDRVLTKAGNLTREEQVLIRKHPIYGADILKDVVAVPHVVEGALYHHERYDGTGYPDGLKGEEIPFVARVITVADSYDAMSTSRIYRKCIKREEIIEEMIRCRGTQFDPHIVDVFVDMLREGFKMGAVSENAIDSAEYQLALAAREMMRRISEEEQPQNGATNVDNMEFGNLYDYLRNLNQRYGNEITLMNLYLDTEGKARDPEKLLDCMTDLNKAVTQNIRSVDVCTRNSTTSFLVLLLNAPYATLGIIMDRISNDFYRLQGSRDVVLHYHVIEADEDVKADSVSEVKDGSAEFH